MLKNILALAAIFLIIFTIFNIYRQIQEAIKSGERLDQANDELTQLQNYNHQLKDKLNDQNTLDFVERQSRDKLNLSRANETIIVIDPKDLESIMIATPSPTPIRPPYYLGWIDLFLP